MNKWIIFPTLLAMLLMLYGLVKRPKRSLAILFCLYVAVYIVLFLSVAVPGEKQAPESLPEPVLVSCEGICVSLDLSMLQRANNALKIDLYLKERGSPLTGTGIAYISASEQYQIPISLALAIAGQESSFGVYCFRPYNAGGIHGFTGADWTDYVYKQFDVLSQWGNPTVPSDCRGYCEGTPQSWLTAVGYFQSEIQGRGIK